MKKAKKRKRQKQKHNYQTVNGFRLFVRIAPVHLFAVLREKHNYYRKPFQRVFTTEAGDELRFNYSPPEEAPVQDDVSEEEWVLYNQFLEWQVAYENDMVAYRTDRNNLMLSTSVKILKIPKNVPQYQSEEWVQELQAGGIEVDASNRKLMYMLAIVLEDEIDYLNIVNLATAEEVTIGDVLRAFDFLRTIVARCPAISDIPEFAAGENEFLSVLSGSAGIPEDGDTLEQVVRDTIPGQADVSSGDDG